MVGKSGVSDHYSLLVRNDAEYAELMSRMPVWDEDICIANCGKKGRGLQAKKTFHKGDPIGSFNILLHFFMFISYVCAQNDMVVIWLMFMETLFMKESPSVI